MAGHEVADACKACWFGDPKAGRAAEPLAGVVQYADLEGFLADFGPESRAFFARRLNSPRRRAVLEMNKAIGNPPVSTEAPHRAGMSDEELLSAYREGADRQAFAELVRRYERELYSYLRRYLGDAEMAEDAFQATFLQVHLKCDQFEEGRKFRPWLYTIATNQAIDAQRRNKRHRSVSLDRNTRQDNGDDVGSLMDLLVSREPTPDSQAESRPAARVDSPRGRPIARHPARRRQPGLLPGTEIPRSGRHFGNSRGHGQKPAARGDLEAERSLDRKSSNKPVAVCVMRDHLIGYLLGALEPNEHEEVEAHLGRDPDLRRELDLIARALSPLSADKACHEPPTGLAHRTCDFVATQAKATPGAVMPVATSRWSMADFAMAAGIFLAATLLFFPAVNQSRFAARLTSCQNNMRQIGMALADYSSAHGGYLPNMPAHGPMAAAGIFATRLWEQGFVSSPQVFICPASQMAIDGLEYHVPATTDLEGAHGEALARLQHAMGGSYGYTFGYISNGRYQSHRNQHRPRFAILADAPGSKAPYHSPNHGGCGQNVLFEDMHVQYLTTCKARGCTDNIFVNDNGDRGPGLHQNDSVIGAPGQVLSLPASVDE